MSARTARVTGTVASAVEYSATANEKQLMQTLIQCARLNNWFVYHTFDSRRSDAGFPDCVCVKGGRMLVFELKAQNGRVSRQQRQWIEAFEDVPMVIAAIVRPEPKEDGEMSFDDALEMLAG